MFSATIASESLVARLLLIEYVRGRAEHDARNRKQQHDALGGGRMGL